MSNFISTFYDNLVNASDKNIVLTGDFTQDLEILRNEFYTDLNCYYENDEICEVCGKKHIKYIFNITNIKTNISLKVGSECITKFPIKVQKTDGTFEMISTYSFENNIDSAVTDTKKRVNKLSELNKMILLTGLDLSTTDIKIIDKDFYTKVSVLQSEINTFLKSKEEFIKGEVITNPTVIYKAANVLKMYLNGKIYVLFFPSNNHNKLYKEAKNYNVLNSEFVVTSKSQWEGFENYVVNVK
jgi:hypothetical protein